MSKIKLETLLVGNIEGDFFVPSYQRGYRWTKNEVVRLLDDIYDAEGNYSLQPIVVKRNNGVLELIDGQQRLTTLYLLYKFFHNKSNGFLPAPKFSISYETREGSKEYLDSLDEKRMDSNIDFWHMRKAYDYIDAWYIDKKSNPETLTNLNTKFERKVQVIWYEVDNKENPISLFTRLNIGKIPLTNAELVKAMFLSSANVGMTYNRQLEISVQWDEMEKQLNDLSFWYFLTNNNERNYPTRIDLLLDLIVNNDKTSNDEYFTFFAFQKLKEEQNLVDVWNKINHTFSILKDWYENHELYHSIGYLIASGYQTISQIYHLSDGKNKKDFSRALHKHIKASIKIKGNYGDLTYESDRDQRYIFRLLLLFNVESVRRIDGNAQRFPFDKFKHQSSGSGIWSLEHINAQNAEGLHREDAKREWLKLHQASLLNIFGVEEELVAEIDKMLEMSTIDSITFNQIMERVNAKLSAPGNVEFMHSISNLALLNSGDNAALSNSTFDVKRGQIIKMDMQGKYIPFCTKMVFLKYYTEAEHTHSYFWDKTDRRAYINKINFYLKDYLDEKIVIDEEALHE